MSTSSPKPSFVPDKHFMRIPINDNYSEKLAPYLQKAFQFLGTAVKITLYAKRSELIIVKWGVLAYLV